MFKIVNSFTGEIIEKTVSVTYVKMQEHETKPTICETYEEADGVLLSNGIDYLGIEGRNMQGFVPLVTVEEVSSDPYIFQQLDETSNKLDTKASQDKVESLEQQTTALMMGMVDVYSKLEAISASIGSNNSSTTVETNE